MTTRPPITSDDWNRHWEAYADTNALNPAQTYRRLLIFDALGLDHAPMPVRLLEIGSGQGELSREIHERFPGVELVGMDLSQTGVEIASAKVPRGRFFQQDLAQPLTLPDCYSGWATHAVCSEVLEHLDDPLGAIRRVRPYLAKGARLVITVPAGPMSAFDKHIGHRSHFRAEQLERLLISAGLRVESLFGAGFPFFNLYRLSVVLRGKKLIEDAGADGPLPIAARAAMRAFDTLFRFNQKETRRGWQIIAVAVEPGGGTDAASS